MDVEWDNQEANNNRNICRGQQQQSGALCLALDIQTHPLLSNCTSHCLQILCCYRAHECSPTQRASSRLTAVHEASTGLTALDWQQSEPPYIHKCAHTHTDRAPWVHGAPKAKTRRGLRLLDLHTYQMKESPVRPACHTLYCSCLWCAPDSPHWVLWLKVALCTQRPYSMWFCQHSKICCIG